jgi:hypothetical protein
MPNGCKIDQMSIKIPHLPLQDPPKITQIWTFGLKIYHLATLIAIDSPQGVSTPRHSQPHFPATFSEAPCGQFLNKG